MVVTSPYKMSVLTGEPQTADTFLSERAPARDGGGTSNREVTDIPLRNDYYQINQQCLSKPSLFTPTPTF